MRSVSRAICTSALPVSAGLSPNLVISSCLRSWVRVMRRMRLAAAKLAGALDILVHLRHQRVDRVEPALAAQAREEVDAQDLPVEVDLAVEQEGFHEHRPPGPEGRADPDVDGGAVAVSAGGIDAVAGADQRLVGHDVGRREAERAPAAVTRDDLAADLKRRAEKARGELDLAGADQPADVARGDDLALDLDERHDAGLEARVRLRHLRVPGGTMPE